MEFRYNCHKNKNKASLEETIVERFGKAVFDVIELREGGYILRCTLKQGSL